MNPLTNKHVLILGGTGSLAKVLLRRLLSLDSGGPARIVVFSRDEDKQHRLRVEYMNRRAATDDLAYRRFDDLLEFRIGDVRDLASVKAALRDVDVVFNTAALKQVPTCEYYPYEAVLTNVLGAENLVRAIREAPRGRVETVIGISTDKAVAPINVMGMTKALQERILARANLDGSGTRFVLVRYGNVLASRGSVIPLFHEQIRQGGPVTITDARMTRFLLSLDDAVDLILAALASAWPGETYVPRLPAARMRDVARALVGDRPIPIITTRIRPGEKIHESLISGEEAFRTIARDPHYVITPILPELHRPEHEAPTLDKPYTSNDELLAYEEVVALLAARGLMPDGELRLEGEALR